VVVNVQGDEPLVPEEAIRALAGWLVASGAPIATYAVPFDDTETLFDPNCVKVVADRHGRALLFSRAPIPWHRDRFARDRVSSLPQRAWRHVGMYAYRAAALRAFAAMPPGRLEQIEALEQLRALEAGWHIAVTATPVPVPAGVDTVDDLERVRSLFR
jgi:3-deoxy-manno-octulosonate cytidylyltransferase (CMP-KDO synthetase)